MAVTLQRFVAFAFLCLLVGVLVAEATQERQSLFTAQQLPAGARALPLRFQEMVQRRRLAAAGSGSYGGTFPGYYGYYGR
jgi:hypothetical protein